MTATAIWCVRKPDDYFVGNWRAGADGSPVMINMVHEIDLLRFLLGEVVEVQALGVQPIRGADRVESGVLALRFESGTVASVTFADTAPSPWGFEAGTGENPNIATSGQDSLWITGTAGAISFPSMTLWRGASDWGEAPSPVREEFARTDPLAAQLDHFIDVLNGAAPLITALDARRSLAVTLDVEAQVTPQQKDALAS